MLAAHCDVQCLRLDFLFAGVVLVVTHILAKDKLRVRFPSPAPSFALVVKWYNESMVRINRQFDSVLEHQLFHSGQSQGTEQADVHPSYVKLPPATA
jgi:hypothetical protein